MATCCSHECGEETAPPKTVLFMAAALTSCQDMRSKVDGLQGRENRGASERIPISQRTGRGQWEDSMRRLVSLR